MGCVQDLTALCAVLVMGSVLSAARDVEGMGGMAQQDNTKDKTRVDMPDLNQGFKMGVPDEFCDDGRKGIEIDYNPKYITCDSNVDLNFQSEPINIEQEELSAKHICLNATIDYGTPLPLNGNHRLLWPKYGEYSFLPPSRWVHSIEHGAVILLYHPCTDTDEKYRDESDSDETDSDESDRKDDHETELNKLKAVLRGCLTKYIIAPYSLIPHDMPFALLAYRHARLLSNANIRHAREFIETYGLTSPETQILEDGQYEAYKKTGVSVVTNRKTCGV